MSNGTINVGYKLLWQVYDLVDVLFFSDKDRSPRYNLVNLIENDESEILDICIGSATTSILLAQKNNRNRITGIDLSKEMMKLAEKKTALNKLSNIQIIEMDATNLKFADKQFDIVTISLALHEMSEPVFTAVLREIYRVLKDNGKLYIIEWDRPRRGLIRKLMFGLIVLLEPKWFGDFLKTDWEKLLQSFRLKLLANIELDYTKLLVVSK